MILLVDIGNTSIKLALYNLRNNKITKPISLLTYSKKTLSFIKSYLKKKTFILDHSKNIQILIPPKYANGFLCLSESCVFHYKLSYPGKYFDVANQHTLKWNDERLKIKWPTTKNLILSARDK